MEKKELSDYNWLVGEINGCEALDDSAKEIMLEAAKSAFTDDLGELTEIFNRLKVMAEARRLGKINVWYEDTIVSTDWDGRQQRSHGMEDLAD